jgi:dihydroorotate dehydrogenase
VLVGAGGIDSPESAFAKIAAGADLLQIYTGLVFKGPGLPRAIVNGLRRILDERGFASITDAVGAEAEKLATETGLAVLPS